MNEDLIKIKNEIEKHIEEKNHLKNTLNKEIENLNLNISSKHIENKKI